MNRSPKILDPSTKKSLIDELSTLSSEVGSTKGPLSTLVRSKIDGKIKYFRDCMSGDIPIDANRILMETETMELLVEIAIKDCRSDLSETKSDNMRDRCNRISRTVRLIAGKAI